MRLRNEGVVAARMDPALAKRWLAGHQAAERRALQVMRDEGAASPEVSFARSMELLDLAPPGDDGFRDREAAHARAAWAKQRVPRFGGDCEADETICRWIW